MSKTISVRLDKSHLEKLKFLYDMYHIQSRKGTERFRELLNVLYTEKTEKVNSPSSKLQHQELELLSDWDCSYRAVVYRLDKHTEKKVPFVHCSAMNTRKILGTNIIDIAVCKKCHDRGASTNFISLPNPKKEDEKKEDIEKEAFLKKARSKNRKCTKCGTDISKLESWKTICTSCWRKDQSPAPSRKSDSNPLRGSPADIRMREAARIRKMNEQFDE